MRWIVAPLLVTACNVDGPPHVDPPVVACTAAPSCETPDAGSDALAWIPTCIDGGSTLQPWDECTLPPSVCADSHWAAYFDDGTCVKGTCELVTKYHYCQRGCLNGACISSGPTAAGRGF